MDLNQNYFSLFKLPQQFAIDEQQLSTRFRQLQREVHPDRYAGKDKHQQMLAMRFSSYINTAYQTLKSPLSRAEYLLELAQMPVNKETMTIADSDFLFKQMEWRDTLSEATDEQCQQTLKELLQTVTDYRATLASAFIQHYDGQDFDTAKETLAKWHFVEKMMNEIGRIEFPQATHSIGLPSHTG